ncbi:MAG: phosphatidylglycerophosphatase A [Loktanella sp.]|nr:phosphatidylglycerophosphatase A [Loktanella sp.]
MSQLVATFFYVGYLKPAPGTWGSLAALPVALVILWTTGPYGLLFMSIVAFGAGYWATVQQTRGQADHDPSEIVIDEVAGQWIALLPVAFGAANNDMSYLALWPGWIAAFVLFRLFDITKPWIIGWADRRNDAMGVMLDDVIAGVFAAIGVGALAALYHVVLV